MSRIALMRPKLPKIAWGGKVIVAADDDFFHTYDDPELPPDHADQYAAREANFDALWGKLGTGWVGGIGKVVPQLETVGSSASGDGMTSPLGCTGLTVKPSIGDGTARVTRTWGPYSPLARVDAFLTWRGHQYTFPSLISTVTEFLVNGVAVDTYPDGNHGYRRRGSDLVTTSPAGLLAVEIGVTSSWSSSDTMAMHVLLDHLTLRVHDPAGAHPNALYLPAPLLDVRSWPEPRQGNEDVEIESGAETAWHTGADGMDYYLEGTAPWIPALDQASYVYRRSATGWNGAAGWDAFLRYAYAGGAFDFYPDRDNDAVFYPSQVVGERERASRDLSMTRRQRLRMRSTTGVPYLGY